MFEHILYIYIACIYIIDSKKQKETTMKKLTALILLLVGGTILLTTASFAGITLAFPLIAISLILIGVHNG